MVAFVVPGEENPVGEVRRVDAVIADAQLGGKIEVGECDRGHRIFPVIERAVVNVRQVFGGQLEDGRDDGSDVGIGGHEKGERNDPG